ncbi:hypothetical protein [Vogesella mureinivorans]|uniref:hypothetical protein n=1 Tax=Vogesella mureinivorans TaxID=657276 RepID=UPI0011C70BA9|nr:hypothetical protein [Vogesella mureinivorans]
MVGFSWETSFGLILSLFAILLISPAGIKRAAEQVISAQVFYGGSYLTFCSLLLNTIAYIWLFNNTSTTHSVNPHLLNLWSGFVSSTFGTVYWVILCLFFIKRQVNPAGFISIIMLPLLMLFQNYLPEIHNWITTYSNIYQLQVETIDYIVTIFLLAIIILLTFLYFTKKHIWAGL